MLPKEIQLPDSNVLSINQCLDYKYAGSVWDSALVFSYFMLKDNSSEIYNPKDKTILELGAGTGILSLLNLYFGAKKVISTDMKDCTSLIKENYEKNKTLLESKGILQIEELNWENIEDRNKVKDKLDYIIGSDLIWKKEQNEILFKTIDYFMEKGNKDCQCVLSFELRNDEVKHFLKLFKDKGYIVEMLEDKYYDELYKDEVLIIVIIKKNKEKE